MRRFFHLIVLGSAGFMLWGLLVEGPPSDSESASPASSRAETPGESEAERTELPTSSHFGSAQGKSPDN